MSVQNVLLHQHDFKPTEIINKSKQGIIYKGTANKNQEEVILKQYNLLNNEASFKKELKILSSLRGMNNNSHLPKLLSYKFNYEIGEMLMSDQGQDLNSLIQDEYDNKPAKNELKQLAIEVGQQVLDALRDLHSTGYIHCDLKLDNICSTKDDITGESNFSLIDFGLVQKYKSSKGIHIQKSKLQHFKGNILFASKNAIKQKLQSRKDDLEGLMHVVCYIYNKMSLPWLENIPALNSPKEISAYFLQQRSKNYAVYSQSIKEILPAPLSIAYSYIRSLGFNEEPKYAYISSLFSQASQCIRKMEGSTQSHFSSNKSKSIHQKDMNKSALQQDLFLLSIRKENVIDEQINADRRHYNKVENVKQQVIGHEIEDSIKDEIESPFDYAMLVNAVQISLYSFLKCSKRDNISSDQNDEDDLQEYNINDSDLQENINDSLCNKLK